MRVGSKVRVSNLSNKKKESSCLPYCENYLATNGLIGTIVYKNYTNTTVIVKFDSGKELAYFIEELEEI